MKLLKLTLFSTALALLSPTLTMAQSTLTGDVRLACEAILCLSSSTRPAECSPSIKRFYSIVRPKYSWTIAARLAFLRKCPVSGGYKISINGIDSVNVGSKMDSLTNAIANAAFSCDPDTLNQRWKKFKAVTTCRAGCGGEGCAQCECTTTYVPVIRNDKPSFCTALENHEYTDYRYDMKYVGTPECNGKWVLGKNYEQEKEKAKNNSCLCSARNAVAHNNLFGLNISGCPSCVVGGDSEYDGWWR